LIRSLYEDDWLPDGAFIIKGNRVTYHSYVMVCMEKIWLSNCLKFQLERSLRKYVFVPKCHLKCSIFQVVEDIKTPITFERMRNFNTKNQLDINVITGKKREIKNLLK